MSCYGYDGNLFFVRAIAPKYSICCRCGLFSISLKNLFSFRPFQCGKLMGLQARMPWILRQKLNGLFYRRVSLEKSLVGFEFVEVG